MVDRQNPQKMVGYIDRASAMTSWLGHLQEESVRERGWLDRFLEKGEEDHSGAHGILIGQVVGIEDARLRISVDGDPSSAVQEFALTQPTRGISLGDHVKVSYRHKDAQRIAVRVEELQAQ